MQVVAELEQLPIAQARIGDATAWDRLFRRYQLPLYVFVVEMVRDEQASLDIVQESFINAVRHLDTLREDQKFGSWLFGIAHQKCIQRWRKENRQETVRDAFAALPPELENSPDVLLMRREQEAGFMALVNRLPLPQRSVLLLHFVEDFSLEEIAAITGSVVGTVKSRLYYAKKTLRKLLEEDENAS